MKKTTNRKEKGNKRKQRDKENNVKQRTQRV